MTPYERINQYTDRIARHNPALNVYLDLRLSEAGHESRAATARAASGSKMSGIDGWSVAIKANIAVSGLPHHAGIRAYSNNIATQDAEVVRRLKLAGAVILGTVNMHEGALGATTDNPFFGRTHNPWKQGYTPGGSSGGSGAAVAAGLCDAALGSDTMGSVRIPSAYCGVQGYKPSPGIVPDGGVFPLSPTLDTVGVHARSVSTIRSVLRVISGEELPDARISLNSLRLGIWDGAGKCQINPDVLAGFSEAIQQIKSSGARMEPTEPPGYTYAASRRAGLLISEVEAHAIHADRLKVAPEGFSPLFRELMEWGVSRPAAQVEAAYAHRRELVARSHELFSAYDFMIAPVAPQTSFSFEMPAPVNQADFTAWANLAGLPAAAICTGMTSAGLPLSVQVIGPPGADGRVLAISEALETLFGTPPLPPGFQR